VNIIEQNERMRTKKRPRGTTASAVRREPTREKSESEASRSSSTLSRKRRFSFLAFFAGNNT
jgi:hypothetical protein